MLREHRGHVTRGSPLRTSSAAQAQQVQGRRPRAQVPSRKHQVLVYTPQGLHVAHLVIDAGVDTAWVRERIAERSGGAEIPPDLLMPPEAVADAYLALYNQPKSAWTFEQEIRPYGEKW